MLDGPNEKAGETRGSGNGTYYAGTMEEESSPLPGSIRALPVSIGSISLSSCQLFLCARQIVAAGTEAGAEAKRTRSSNVEWGGEGLN